MSLISGTVFVILFAIMVKKQPDYPGPVSIVTKLIGNFISLLFQTIIEAPPPELSTALEPAEHKVLGLMVNWAGGDLIH